MYPLWLIPREFIICCDPLLAIYSIFVVVLFRFWPLFCQIDNLKHSLVKSLIRSFKTPAALARKLEFSLSHTYLSITHSPSWLYSLHRVILMIIYALFAAICCSNLQFGTSWSFVTHSCVAKSDISWAMGVYFVYNSSDILTSWTSFWGWLLPLGVLS